MSEKKEFEKIWLFLKGCMYYDEVSIAIANAPSDWSVCSVVISGWKNMENKFMSLQLNREEAEKIIDAMSAVLADMPAAQHGAQRTWRATSRQSCQIAKGFAPLTQAVTINPPPPRKR